MVVESDILPQPLTRRGATVAARTAGGGASGSHVSWRRLHALETALAGARGARVGPIHLRGRKSRCIAQFASARCCPRPAKVASRGRGVDRADDTRVPGLSPADEEARLPLRVTVACRRHCKPRAAIANVDCLLTEFPAMESAPGKTGLRSFPSVPPAASRPRAACWFARVSSSSNRVKRERRPSFRSGQ